MTEVDGYLSRIEKGGTTKLRDLEILFAPTGSLQGVSIDSGWGERFLGLADRFERAIADL